MSKKVQLEQSSAVAELARVTEALGPMLHPAEDAELRRAFVDYIAAVAERRPPPGVARPRAGTLEESGMSLAERAAEWPERIVEELFTMTKQASTDLVSRLPGAPEDMKALWRVFVSWDREMADWAPTPHADLSTVETLEDLQQVLRDGAVEWPRLWRQKGIYQGKTKGVVETASQQRALLGRQAELRFGSGMTEQVTDALKWTADPERLAAVGEAIVRCESRGEFVEWLTNVVKTMRGVDWVAAWPRLWRHDGIEEGKAQGLAEGLEQQRALLSRQAALLWGHDMGQWVAAVLDRIEDPARMTDACEALVQIQSGYDALDRLKEISEEPTHGPLSEEQQLQEEGAAEGMEQAVAEGLAQQRALLARQAVQRFGAETAERVADALEPVTEPEHLAEAGATIVQCASGDELVDRLARLLT